MCPECYSKYKRITPLLNPEVCLMTHRQYICSTCGRHICAAIDINGKFRALFPFKSFEIAKLYLRSAEVILEKKCGIFEIEGKNGRLHYKIFSSKDDLNDYLNKNENKICKNMKPLFKSEQYKNYNQNQLRMISEQEVRIYLSERTVESEEWRSLI